MPNRTSPRGEAECTLRSFASFGIRLGDLLGVQVHLACNLVTTYAQDYDMNAIPDFDALEQVRRYYGEVLKSSGDLKLNISLVTTAGLIVDA
jgi:hypothetical protein